MLICVDMGIIIDRRNVSVTGNLHDMVSRDVTIIQFLFILAMMFVCIA